MSTWSRPQTPEREKENTFFSFATSDSNEFHSEPVQQHVTKLHRNSDFANPMVHMTNVYITGEPFASIIRNLS